MFKRQFLYLFHVNLADLRAHFTHCRRFWMQFLIAGFQPYRFAEKRCEHNGTRSH